MLVYNVHGSERLEHYEPTADWTGLSKLLGWRPIFCSYVNPDSLTDTWFRLFSASSNFKDEIDVFEVDDRFVVGIDAVLWQDTCVSDTGERRADDETLKDAMASDCLESREYLLRPDYVAKRSWHFTLEGLLSGVVDYDVDPELTRALAGALADVRRSMTGEAGYTDDARYAMAIMSGAVPLMWSIVTSRHIDPALVSIRPATLVKGTRVSEAIRMLRSWDEAFAAGEPFGIQRFKAMRSAYVSGLNQAAHLLIDERAKRAGTSRNGECFCGSKRKFKRCCARKGMDEIALTW